MAKKGVKKKEKVKKIQLFDWLNSINFGKADLMVDEESEALFDTFIIRRGLAQCMETVLIAEMANRNDNPDKRRMYDFLRLATPKRKRYSSWVKKSQASEDVLAISQYFEVSLEKAEQYFSLMNEYQVETIKSRLDQGGLKK